MADQRTITLYQGASPSTDIILRALPLADVVETTIYLYAGASPSTDIILRDPTAVPSGGGGFPTQFPGLRVYYGGAVRSLCMVAVADAPTGDTPMVHKNGTTYAVYLVDTTDPNASSVRLRTNDGTKAIRLLT